ncbi:hypothetical protein [Nonomuraea polychroma]|uniref:hypothetical protein n=1 Tax=Nonomuraea polychroma TaxID=46176 RepID=UPI001F4E6302|nr:hypothetical protein [Nonomuraea polychroma]
MKERAGSCCRARRTGSRPTGAAPVAWCVDPAAIASMAERGIDVSREFPTPWTDEIARAADVVVTMGCGDACPVYPGKRLGPLPAGPRHAG